MAWPGFTTRSLDRDRETDRVRMEHILAVLAAQIHEIESEGTGLQGRYRRAADDAAFSLEAMENGNASLSAKVGALTDAMSRYKERTTCLETDAAFLRTLRESIVSFMADR